MMDQIIMEVQKDTVADMREVGSVLAQNLSMNPLLRVRNSQVDLIDEHAFDGIDIVNPRNSVAHSLAAGERLAYPEIETQTMASPPVESRAQHTSPVPRQSMVYQQIPQTPQPHLSGREYQHDPSMYGVEYQPPPQIAPANSEALYRPRLPAPRPPSRFRVLESVPWWVLLLVFFVCLGAFGGLIAWMFRHRGSAVVRAVVPVPIPATVSKVTQVVETNQPVMPMVKRKKFIGLDDDGNLVQEVRTKILTHHPHPAGNIVIKEKVTRIDHPAQEITEVKVKDVKETKEAKSVTQTPTAPINLASLYPNSTIVILPGRQQGWIQFCPKTSFSFNGKCYSCPEGLTWSGSNCIRREHRHLRRS